MVSLEQVRSWRPEVLHEAASRISGHLQQLVGVGDQLDAAAAPAGWSGPAAEAAAVSAAGLTAGIREAAADSASVQAAAVNAAVEIEALQRHLVAVEEFAAASGLVIGAGGEVTKVGAVPVSDPVVVAQREQTRVSVAGQVRAVLARAEDVDAQLAVALRRVDMPVPAAPVGATTAQAAAAGAGRGPVPPVPVGADAVANRDWWGSLTPPQRDALIRARPAEVGNLAGVPAVDRDRANRVTFDQTLDQVRARTAALTGSERPEDRAELERLLPVQGGLDAMQRSMQPPDGSPGALLLGFRDTRPGQFVMSHGNPDTATQVATMVPGMDSSYGSNLDRALTLRDQLNLDTLNPEQTAVITYLDYAAPQGWEAAAGTASADAGVGGLREFQEGLRATHDEPRSSNTVIAHSYGSVLTGHTARDVAGGGLDADRIVALGSPGMGVENAAGLHRAPGQVWAGATWADHVTYAPVHGPAPADDGFGARDVDTSTFGGHSSYFDPRSDTMAQLSRIVRGVEP